MRRTSVSGKHMPGCAASKSGLRVVLRSAAAWDGVQISVEGWVPAMPCSSSKGESSGLGCRRAARPGQQSQAHWSAMHTRSQIGAACCKSH